MVSTQSILERLTGNGIVEALEAIMAENFEDFAETKKRYIGAISALQASFDESATSSPKDEMNAIQRQMASSLLFTGLLGLKANLDHYIDPVAKNFLDVEPETYLREEMAHRLPEYVNAQEIRDQFYALLSPEQQELYEDIDAYVCYLETAGPKLAHYYGYILGNELLYKVVPGYYPDPVQTMRYTAMLEDYFGKEFSNIVAALW